jgi:hypothetical protein
MYAANPRLFEPAIVDGRANPRHLTRNEYLALALAVAERVAHANGASGVAVRFPDGDSFAPVRIRVEVRRVVEVRQREERRRVPIEVLAEAELAPGILDGLADGDGYDGPLAYRQGKPMRPDVALAFDRSECGAGSGRDAVIALNPGKLTTRRRSPSPSAPPTRSGAPGTRRSGRVTPAPAAAG